MNEQIKKLMVEAIKGREREGLLNDEDKLEALMDKFAELIVKECTTICKDTAEKHYNPVLYRHESIAAFTCHRKIKEHFGVEE